MSAPGLEAIADALRALGNGDAATSMGALEAHGQATRDALNHIADALRDGLFAVAEAIECARDK